MKKSSLAVFALTLAGAFLFGHQPAFAQDSTTQASSDQSSQKGLDQDIALLRKDIRSGKKQLIAVNVPLTDTEAQKFWPIYDQYTAELVQINNTKYALLKQYAENNATVTDAQANDWAPKLLQGDVDVATLRQKYWPKITAVLPPKKALLYEQVERQAQLLIDVQLAVQIPLVQP
jgi:Spy/CpxP family protein refolding chaperone